MDKSTSIVEPASTNSMNSQSSNGGFEKSSTTFSTTNVDFTPTQERQMAEWLRDAGKLSNDQARELRDSGVLSGPEATRPLSPEAQVIDRHFPPAKPHEYLMPKFVEDGQPYSKEAQARDTAFREWLSTARFPKEIGSSLAQDAHKESLKIKSMDPVERELWAASELQKLGQIFGHNQVDQKLALAGQLLTELEAKSPGLKSYLKESGLADSATFVAQIVMQAERLQARLPKE